jgi:predicted nucleic acid-binding protein
VGRRLILDTSVLIAYERGTVDRSSLDHDELAIASVSVAEYRAGIEMADTASRAAERARALAAITSTVDVLDYTQATAAHHGRLLGEEQRDEHAQQAAGGVVGQPRRRCADRGRLAGVERDMGARTDPDHRVQQQEHARADKSVERGRNLNRRSESRLGKVGVTAMR